MTEIINLNKARKSKKAAQKEQQATENRVKFGRTKIEKNFDKAQQRKNNSNKDLTKLGSDDNE